MTTDHDNPTDPRTRELTLADVADTLADAIDASRADWRRRPGVPIPWEEAQDPAGRPIHLEILATLVQARAADVLAGAAMDTRKMDDRADAALTVLVRALEVLTGAVQDAVRALERPEHRPTLNAAHAAAGLPPMVAPGGVVLCLHTTTTGRVCTRERTHQGPHHDHEGVSWTTSRQTPGTTNAERCTSRVMVRTASAVDRDLENLRCSLARDHQGPHFNGIHSWTDYALEILVRQPR